MKNKNQIKRLTFVFAVLTGVCLSNFWANAQNGGPAIAGAPTASAPVEASSGAGGAGSAVSNLLGVGGSGATGGQGSPWLSLLPFVLMFGVMYFLMIRPQQKKLKEQQSMLSALKKGDQVVTASGFLGKVAQIQDKVVTLELSDNVKVQMLKSQVAQVVQGQIKDLAQV